MRTKKPSATQLELLTIAAGQRIIFGMSLPMHSGFGSGITKATLDACIAAGWLIAVTFGGYRNAPDGWDITDTGRAFVPVK